MRKSARGKKVSAKDIIAEEQQALDASSPSDKNPSTLLSGVPPEVQKKEEEVEAARQTDVSASSAGQKTQPQLPEVQTPEQCVEEGEEEKEGWSRADIKGTESWKRKEFISI